MTYFREKIQISGIILIVLTLVSFLFKGCSNNVDSNSPTSSGGTEPGSGSTWLIPESEVFGGGPGKDGIPALLSPAIQSVSQINFLDDDDLIIGIRVKDEVRGYPHQILDWHEIINDDMGGEFFAVTYCPLTGSGIGWSRNVNGNVTTFGVSGLLYNTNLIPYDRATGSNWSQMKLQSVNGVLKSTNATLVPVVETTWKTFSQLYPDAKVVTQNTGSSRPYGSYPYGDYRTNNSRLLFPVDNFDERLPGKSRIVGVAIDGKSKAFNILNFTDNTTAQNLVFNKVPIVVVGNRFKNFGVIYQRTLNNGTLLTFEPINSNTAGVMIDNEGTTWDLFGYGLSGPRAGERLQTVESYIAYWFAWGAFHPDSEL